MNNIPDDSKMTWVIKCQHCNKEYEEGTPEAEFIGWHGLCAECELNNVEKCDGWHLSRESLTVELPLPKGLTK